MSVLLIFPHLKDLKILVSIAELVDKNLPSSKNYQNFKDEFQLKNTFSIILKKNEQNWSRNTIEKVESWQRQVIHQDDYAKQIFSPLSFLTAKIENQEYIFYKKLIKKLDKSQDLTIFNKTPWKNVITDRTGSEFTMEIELEDAPPPQKFGSFNPFSIKEIINSSKKTFSKDYQTLMVGPAIFTHYAFEGVKQNSYINFAYLLFVFILFKIIFGTYRSGFFLLLSFSWVGICVYGIMSLFKIPIEILSSGLFIMIAVASLEDYYFILHENTKGKTLNEAFALLRMPSFLTSCTTIFGFGSLYFSGIDLVARFGIMAAIGAFLEWIAVFIVLPAMFDLLQIRSLVDPNKTSSLITSDKWNSALNKIKPNKKISLATLVFFPLSIIVLLNLKVSGSPLSLFPKNHILTKDFETFSSSRGWESYASVVFDENISHKDEYEIVNNISKVKNIKQIENQKTLNKFLTTGVPNKFHSVVKNDFKGSSLHKRYESEYYKRRHILYFKKSHYEIMIKTKERIESICKMKCKLIGEIISYTEFTDKIPLGFIKSLGISLLTVAFFIFFLSYKFKFPNPLLFSMASLWGPSILLLLLYLTGIRINFLSCVFVTMMVGLTGDNAIQFIYAQKKEQDGIQYHQKCALQMGILLCISCLFFLLSYFAPPREFGVVMAIGFLFSLFGDICIAKTLTQKT